jgi:hypothetical protein
MSELVWEGLEDLRGVEPDRNYLTKIFPGYILGKGGVELLCLVCKHYEPEWDTSGYCREKITDMKPTPIRDITQCPLWK